MTNAVREPGRWYCAQCDTSSAEFASSAVCAADWLAHKQTCDASQNKAFTLMRSVARNLVMPRVGDDCDQLGVHYVCTHSDHTSPERPVLTFVRRT